MAELVKALNSNLSSNYSMGYARACSNHAVDVILFFLISMRNTKGQPLCSLHMAKEANSTCIFLLHAIVGGITKKNSACFFSSFDPITPEIDGIKYGKGAQQCMGS